MHGHFASGHGDGFSQGLCKNPTRKLGHAWTSILLRFLQRNSEVNLQLEHGDGWALAKNPTRKLGHAWTSILLQISAKEL